MMVMNIQNTLYHPFLTNTIYPSLLVKSAVDAQPVQKSEPADSLSALTQFVYSHEFTEFSYISDETIIGYRSKDNSMALRAHSRTDLHLQQEKISLEITYSAEALGLTAKDFERTGGKSIELFFSLRQTQTRLEYKSTTELTRTMRKPEDILRDLSKALVDALRDKGSGSISLRLDDEAIQALMQDENFAKLFKEIMLIISFINMLKRMQGEKGQREVHISGKGEPILNYDESLSVDSKETIMDFKLTILPPGYRAEAVPLQAIPEPEPVQVAIPVQETQVDVAV
jgi:hypothetical protein